MIIYIVQRAGIYWQGVFGVFNDKDIAIEYAKKLKKNDIDDYHNFVVSEIAMNNHDSIPAVKLGGYEEPAIDIFETPKRTT